MFLTLKQLASKLNINLKTLTSHYRRGILPCSETMTITGNKLLVFDIKKLNEYQQNLEAWQEAKAGKVGKPIKVFCEK